MIRERLKDFLADSYLRVFGLRGPYSRLAAETALVFRGQLPAGDCRRLVAGLGAELDKGSESSGLYWQDDEGADQRFFQFERVCPDAVRILDIPAEIRKISRYLGFPVGAWTLLASRIVDAPGNKGSGGGWHRDSAFRHQVKVLWYLTDVGNDNGPFCYLPGSNFRRRSDRATGYGTRHASEVDGGVAVIGPAGTKLVCDTKCFHGGAPLKVGARFAVTLYTFETKGQMELLFAKLRSATKQ